jgi:hypothetical protein
MRLKIFFSLLRRGTNSVFCNGTQKNQSSSPGLGTYFPGIFLKQWLTLQVPLNFVHRAKAYCYSIIYVETLSLPIFVWKNNVYSVSVEPWVMFLIALGVLLIMDRCIHLFQFEPLLLACWNSMKLFLWFEDSITHHFTEFCVYRESNGIPGHRNSKLLMFCLLFIM